MKNKIFVLLAVISVLLLISLPVLAEDDASGFYDIGTHPDVEIEVYKGDEKVDATTENLDGDAELEKWYDGSDRFELSYTAAEKGGYYGIMLVEGSGLPTKDNQILYIDQVTAKSDTIDFNVYPMLPEKATPLTLYMLSNVEDFEFMVLPLNYYLPGEDYLLGDIDNNGKVEVDDALIALQIVAEIHTPTETEILAADVDGNGKVEVDDSLMILQYVAEIIDSWN